mmetsp:Transcript_9403/g.18005  ORF Transcript_9403/g.18005 Transcript_9403/m.18005 type:complete len:152 (-) Transcript_9403:1643-2098(-)
MSMNAFLQLASATPAQHTRKQQRIDATLFAQCHASLSLPLQNSGGNVHPTCTQLQARFEMQPTRGSIASHSNSGSSKKNSSRGKNGIGSATELAKRHLKQVHIPQGKNCSFSILQVLFGRVFQLSVPSLELFFAHNSILVHVDLFKQFFSR